MIKSFSKTQYNTAMVGGEKSTKIANRNSHYAYLNQKPKQLSGLGHLVTPNFPKSNQNSIVRFKGKSVVPINSFQAE